MLPKESSLAEIQYPIFDWKKVWKNFNSIIFNTYEKEILFKHLHVCLATNQRLSINYGSKWNKPLSKLYWKVWPNSITYSIWVCICKYVKPVFLLLLRILSNVCNFKPTSNIRFLYFDQKYCNVTQKNICNMFLYLYISTIWKTRKENIRISILKNSMLKRISNHISTS